MSVMRKEQWLGRYSSGNASYHHHVVWLLKGHQEPAGSTTLSLRLKLNSVSNTRRHTASTSGDMFASPCWIGARCSRFGAACTGMVDASRMNSRGNPLGQIKFSENQRYTLIQRDFPKPTAPSRVFEQSIP